MVGRLVQVPEKPTTVAQEITSKANICYIESDEYKSRKETKLWEQSTVRFGSVFIIFLILVVLLWPILTGVNTDALFFINKSMQLDNPHCSFSLVETIPEGLKYSDKSPKHVSTYDTWKNLIKIAEHSIEIGSFYWTLKKWPTHPNESRLGDDIFNDLLEAGLKRKILIKIAKQKESNQSQGDDIQILVAKQAAQVKYLDFSSLINAGILHSKFWIVDRKHFYLGSANLDWRALNQVKELGIVVYNCSTLAKDLAKIFDVYWTVGNKTSLPNKWPDYLNTNYNSQNPFKLVLNGRQSSVFISSSPPQFSTNGRNEDIDALLYVIRNAEKYIHISVMDYIPVFLFSKNLKYWPVIDDALREAVVNRNIQVRLLISKWNYTRPMEFNFLKSLAALNRFQKGRTLEIKLFRVPSTNSQSLIPYARVNHNKYMVTDKAALIGTSNWSADYFTNTAGVSFVSIPSVNETTNIIQEQLSQIFQRDWSSSYATNLTF